MPENGLQGLTGPILFCYWTRENAVYRSPAKIDRSPIDAALDPQSANI